MDAARQITRDYCRRIHCRDVGELNRSTLEWRGDFVQLSPGAFRAEGWFARFGAVSLARISLNQTVLTRLHAPGNSVAFLFPGHGSGLAHVLGHRIEPTECVVVGKDACCEAISKRHAVWLAIALDLTKWRSELHWAHDQPISDDKQFTVLSSSAWRSTVEDSTNWIFNAYAGPPMAFAGEDVGTLLSDRLMYEMARIQPSASRVLNGSCTRLRRRMAVERAREYIHGHCSERIRLSDLCRCAHTEARSLEIGFREICGMPPIAYVRAFKLAGVRRALLSAAPPLRTISEIACDHGFWHLGQFSAHYRKQYGERPSATRARACGSLPHLRTSERRLPSQCSSHENSLRGQIADVTSQRFEVQSPINAAAVGSR